MMTNIINLRFRGQTPLIFSKKKLKKKIGKTYTIRITVIMLHNGSNLRPFVPPPPVAAVAGCGRGRAAHGGADQEGGRLQGGNVG